MKNAALVLITALIAFGIPAHAIQPCTDITGFTWILQHSTRFRLGSHVVNTDSGLSSLKFNDDGTFSIAWRERTIPGLWAWQGNGRRAVIVLDFDDEQVVRLARGAGLPDYIPSIDRAVVRFKWIDGRCGITFAFKASGIFLKQDHPWQRPKKVKVSIISTGSSSTRELTP